MQFSLNAISPIDGRYKSKCASLEPFFSEMALIKYRVLIEIEYLIELADLGINDGLSFSEKEQAKLRSVYQNFSIEDAKTIKETEKVTNHDVKAVEYFVKEALKDFGREDVLEFVHFGLTSQDINNTAIPLSIKEAMETVYLPQLEETIETLNSLAREWKDESMLAKTHGQPASPTKLGKEIKVFAERLSNQLELLKQVPNAAKFGGATGNFNAHQVAYPNEDWVKFGNHFVNKNLGLKRSATTTQIEHYDHLAAKCDGLKRINTILIDFCRDIWTYVSMEYFKQKIKAGEIGSSAMPHKVNPIDFENAEGNLGIANAILEHLAAKLPISRLQRDLTDSTVLRNIGVPFGHIMIAFASIEKGLGKLLLNKEALSKDLEENWAVVAEALQTILRREGYPKPYEALKGLTRTNEAINKESIHNFIDSLNVSEDIKSEMKQISPSNYTGVNLV